MANSDMGGCLAGLIPIGYVVGWLVSGYLAYDWVQPDSFGRILVFLLAWGLIGYVVQLILGGLLVLIGSNMG